MEKNYIDTKRLNNIENKLFFLTDSEKVKISIESGNIELTFLGTVVIDSRGMKSLPFGGKLLFFFIATLMSPVAKFSLSVSILNEKI